ncbi:MAG: DUF58 domain-containing protein [Lentisphaerae bacterium]|nr:DUF58 domain-containing protein [Lentisphaerota bacterium]
MIVPSSRLLAWTAAAGLGLAGLAVAHPALAAPAAALAGALAVVAGLDAARGRRGLEGASVAVPPLVRLSRDQDGSFPVRVVPPAAAGRVVVGLAVPRDLGAPATRDAVVADGAATVLAWPCRPLRRGRLDIRTAALETASPLGLWLVRRRMDAACEVRVYPNLREETRRAAARFLRRGGAGAHRMRQVGKGREFEKLREYIPGDSYEDIHWKATARRRHPVTKVYQIERTQEVYVAIDASRLSARLAPSARNAPPGSVPQTVLDRFLAAGLTLTAAAREHGDRFGLVVFDRRILRFVRAGHGASHIDHCRNALYELEPGPASPDYDELFTFLRTRLRKRALVVVLTGLDDALAAEAFQRGAGLVARQHLTLAFSIRPAGAAPLFTGEAPRDTTGVYRRLEGHECWRRLEETRRSLRRLGIAFDTLIDERMSADLVSNYVTVKQRQLL